VATLAWALSLAVADGAAGLTRSLSDAEGYSADVAQVGDDPGRFLRDFTAEADGYSPTTRGHPPGPVLLLWALHRLGVTDRLALGLLLTAVGALAVPLVLAAVRGSPGELSARRYAPVLALAPAAVWTAVSLDAVVGTLGAAALAAGVRASAGDRRGWPATGWAVTAGLLTGVAALFSYAAPWLGLSVVFLYFARRRPFLNLGTGLGALLPVFAAQATGFGWVDGLAVAARDHADRITPHRSALWWSGISLVALLLATGPALVASARKLRNTPGWPFLAGAGLAVAFSVAAGLARGGVENAWLPLFPWLTLAAVAPLRQAGEPVPTPLLLTGVGAGTAVVVEAVLATPW
jgi:hypothetical protein